MKGRLKQRSLLKVGNGLAAMLSPSEVGQVEEYAREAGQRATIWAADAVRARLISEARRHGATGWDSPHELSPHLIGREARAAGSSPAILSSDSPVAVRGLPAVRSWGDLGTDERIALASEWILRVPLPGNFKTMNAQEKTAWCDASWPLAEILPGRTQEEDLEF